LLCPFCRLHVRFFEVPIGILGMLTEAKRRQLIPRIRPVLDNLRHQAGFWVTDALYQRVLAVAGE
ncbi:MAG: DUF3368 domain-containing protein, partial [Candidatus Competibacter sp.]